MIQFQMSASLTPFDEGILAGKSGKDTETNPYPLDSNDGDIWHGGWRTGNFELLKNKARRLESVVCPHCDAKTLRVVLADGSELHDPNGEIFRCVGEEQEDLDVPDYYCDSCHCPFDENEKENYKFLQTYEQNDSAKNIRFPIIEKPSAVGEVGYVYVVRSGHVRIGKASSESRYKSYRTSLPNGCEILRVWRIQLPLVAEQWLHNQYARYRIRGSWYNLPSDKLKELLNITDFPKPSNLIRIHE